MKYGNLNFLEPSGPLQACNGTAFYIKVFICLGLVILDINSAFSKTLKGPVMKSLS
jgi:hypothetical protein